MASKEKLPAWIQENVPDDAVWSEYYLIARKEETRSGNRVLINQTLKEPREVSISGKEVKGYLRDQSSPTIGVVLIVIGLAVVTLMMVLKTLGTSGGYLLFQLLIFIFKFIDIFESRGYFESRVQVNADTLFRGER